MSNNICTNPAYINSLDQKKRFQLFNIPPVRYNNLTVNPYLSINPSTGVPFTKFDLDMRRKVEILKYASTRMSTQTNSLTKAQKFTQYFEKKQSVTHERPLKCKKLLSSNVT